MSPVSLINVKVDKSANDDEDQKFIKVFANGELRRIPDIIRASIVITAKKSTLALCQKSIEKRRNYLHKIFFKIMDTEKQSLCSSKTKKSNLYVHQLTWFVLLESVDKWHDIKNVIVEKLDHVTISKPEFEHSSRSLTKARQMAYTQAVEQGKLKAYNAAEIMDMRIGGVISIEEIESKEWKVGTLYNTTTYVNSDDDKNGESSFKNSKEHSNFENSVFEIHNKMQSNCMSFNTKLSLTFELARK